MEILMLFIFLTFLSILTFILRKQEKKAQKRKEKKKAAREAEYNDKSVHIH